MDFQQHHYNEYNESPGLTAESPPMYEATIVDNPPPYNPSFMNRVGGTLRTAATGVEEFFLSQEHVPESNRAGTLPRRTAGYAVLPQDERTPPPPEGRRGRERMRRGARGLANTMTLRGNRRQVGSARAGRDSDTPTRREVMESLPTFWPVCTIVITITQVVMFVAVCIALGLAPIAISTTTERSGCLYGFANPTCSREQREVSPNFFIGPSSESLIHVGAQFTPCMRDNVAFLVEAAKERNKELNLRCCHANNCGYDSCGMIPLDNCLDDYGDCTEILGGASVCRNESVFPDQCGNVTVHPCCVGVLGSCILTSKENCSFQNGYYHPELAVCSDIGEGCFDDVCSFSWSGGINAHQGLRFLFAMFLHRGVIDLVIVLLCQLYIGCRVERRIGWLRVFLIYIMSGVGGFLLSGIFVPKTVSVGGSGSLFGLLGVQLVELIQGWKWIEKPCIELTKLIIFDLVLLALGVLPYIDNYANIGGFIFGVLSSFVLVPYITVGKWDRVKKLCLILIALPVIAFLYLAGFVVFYNLPVSEFCSWCSYIDCIPFTSTFCDDFIGTVTRYTNIIPPSTK